VLRAAAAVSSLLFVLAGSQARPGQATSPLPELGLWRVCRSTRIWLPVLFGEFASSPATVTAAALYGSGIGTNSFREHIDVAFPAPRGEEHGVRIWIAEQNRFVVGQQVQMTRPIPVVPSARGADIGPIGFLILADID
jgi:hypothetical protein